MTINACIVLGLGYWVFRASNNEKDTFWQNPNDARFTGKDIVLFGDHGKRFVYYNSTVPDTSKWPWFFTSISVIITPVHRNLTRT